MALKAKLLFYAVRLGASFQIFKFGSDQKYTAKISNVMVTFSIAG